MTTNIVKISIDQSVQTLVAGNSHTCALLQNGSAKCWGDNTYGQIGIEEVIRRGSRPNEMGSNLPTLTFEKPIIQMVAGSSHTCALLQNGNVKCWGSHEFGQLGIGESTNLGVVKGSMQDPKSVPLGAKNHAVFLTAGASHTCALLQNGNAKCWGDNTYGQLGIGDTDHRGKQLEEMGDALPEVQFAQQIKKITAGASHTCALLQNGNAKCWGNNTYGQLGLGDTNHRGDQPNEMGANLPVVPLKSNQTFSEIVSGGHFNCALLNDGQAQCWGNNTDGQLGQGNTSNRGDQPNEMGDHLPVIEVISPHHVKQGVAVIATSKHSCAILDNDIIKCWGDNTHGQLGLGDTNQRGDQPKEMGARLSYVQLGSTVTAISVNTHFSCAILSQGKVKCWGNNTDGQLGLNSQTSIGKQIQDMNHNLPTIDLAEKVTQLTLGNNFACVLLQNQNVQCWGNNIYGQLGLGDRNARGDHTLPVGSTTINLGTGRTAKSITAGDSHACAILDNNTVKCWGRNLYGQLGQGNVTEYGSIPNMGDTLPVVNLGAGRTAKSITAGNSHTCAILDNNTVKCWGNNSSGQLGLGDENRRGDGLNEMGDALPVVNLGTGHTAKSITAGNSHTCAILDNNTIKCWGNNNSGQLGLDDTSKRGDGVNEMGDALPVVNLGVGRTAKSITAGFENTCAVLDNQMLKCWGNNSSGQLGLGDTNHRGDQANEMTTLQHVSL